MIDSLGDVGAGLSRAKPDSSSNLYTAAGLQVRDENEARTADVSIQPRNRVNSKCVRGRSCSLTKRLRLP